jgi:hypothetical protein
MLPLGSRTVPAIEAVDTACANAIDAPRSAMTKLPKGTDRMTAVGHGNLRRILRFAEKVVVLIQPLSERSCSS